MTESEKVLWNELREEDFGDINSSDRIVPVNTIS